MDTMIVSKNPATGAGQFYLPTILTDTTPDMDVIREETFGPVLPIIPFDTIDEAIEQANDSRFGLSASVWTTDVAKGEQIAKRLVTGAVTINDSLYTYGLAQTPWGGVKESGFGRTHGKEGLLEMVRPVQISGDRMQHMKKLWWRPYSQPVFDALKNGLGAMAQPGIGAKAKLLFNAASKILPLPKKL
jgi:succinate-semialdehyde dehydrogenase/glutarate-semialdehyde dehydrogenase